MREFFCALDKCFLITGNFTKGKGLLPFLIMARKLNKKETFITNQIQGDW